jgi:hypothetical protein
MRCMACGAEMRVMRVDHDAVDHDATVASVAAVERQILQCAVCQDIETRTVLRHDSLNPIEAAAPLASSSPAPQGEPALSGPALVDDELLLQRAIEMVRSPARGQPVRGLTEPEPTGLRPADGTPDPTDGLAAPISPAADADLDEGEAMLRRAIEMVRSPDRSAKSRTSISGKRSAPSRVVTLCHDSSFEAAYAAKDTTTGLVVIRHQDRARLRAMCERLGWQVLDTEAPAAGA